VVPATGVALVAAWAVASPISGLRCSAVLLDTRRLATARHCLDGTDVVVALGGSLCDPLQGDVPRLASPDEPERRFVGGGADLAIVGLDRQLRAEPTTIERPRRGPAFVVGYGEDPLTGRVGCRASSYEAELVPCAAGLPARWCLFAPQKSQLCGGSSGAPVFVRSGPQESLVGIISAGPRCAMPGPILVSTFLDG